MVRKKEDGLVGHTDHNMVKPTALPYADPRQVNERNTEGMET